MLNKADKGAISMTSKWLTVQRVGLFLYLSIGVLLLVYALGFITDTYLFYAYGNKGLTDFYQIMQGLNAGFLWKAIYVIIFAVVLFILELKDHIAGLFTLIITLLLSLVSIVFSVDSILKLSVIRENYTTLDLSYLQRYIDRGTITYTASTLTYDLGFALHILFLCSSLFLGVVVFYNACSTSEINLNEKERVHEAI
jgi:hypothetical protein